MIVRQAASAMFDIAEILRCYPKRLRHIPLSEAKRFTNAADSAHVITVRPVGRLSMFCL